MRLIRSTFLSVTSEDQSNQLIAVTFGPFLCVNTVKQLKPLRLRASHKLPTDLQNEEISLKSWFLSERKLVFVKMFNVYNTTSNPYFKLHVIF